jgi:hypothetical protein
VPESAQEPAPVLAAGPAWDSPEAAALASG